MRRAAIFLRVDLCIDVLALSFTRVAFATGPIATPRQMSQAVGLLRLRSAPDPGLEMSAVLRSPGRYSSRAACARQRRLRRHCSLPAPAHDLLPKALGDTPTE